MNSNGNNDDVKLVKVRVVNQRIGQQVARDIKAGKPANETAKRAVKAIKQTVRKT